MGFKKKLSVSAVSVAVIGSGLLCAPTAGAEESLPHVPDPATTGVELASAAYIAADTNVQRVMHGKKPLRVLAPESLELAYGAHQWSGNMAEDGYFRHSQTNNEYGENIYLSYTTDPINPIAWQATPAWMNSEGHRANILNDDYEYLGVGVAYDGNGTAYATQQFK